MPCCGAEPAGAPAILTQRAARGESGRLWRRSSRACRRRLMSGKLSLPSGKVFSQQAEPPHIGLSPPSRQPAKFQQSSLRLEVLECRKRRTSCFPHMALAPRSVGAASGTDAGRCLAGSLGAARLPTRRRAAMAQPQRLPLLGSRPGAAEIGAPSHRLQHPRGTAVLPTPPRPANTIRRAVVKGRGAKYRRRRAVPF